MANSKKNGFKVSIRSTHEDIRSIKYEAIEDAEDLEITSVDQEGDWTTF